MVDDFTPENGALRVVPVGAGYRRMSSLIRLPPIRMRFRVARLRD
jgi:hypothetical protein